MEFEVILKEDVHNELFALMHNIKKLNNGDEIGGWLLGDWEFNGSVKLVLDEFIIPKQDVSGGEVDISPESMIDTMKELGPEKCNRIKAHWHIHPFGNGNTSWSSIDEAKITDFMEPEKGREIFCFLLSSEDQIKARIEMNIKGRVLGKEISLRKSQDDIEVHKESSADLNPIYAKLENRIKEKVSRKTYSQDWWKKEEVKKDPNFVVDVQQDRVHVSLEPDFADFIEQCGFNTEELECPDKISKKKGRIRWRFTANQGHGKSLGDIIGHQLESIDSEFEIASAKLMESEEYPKYYAQQCWGY